MHEEHAEVPSPPPDAVLWRYVDFTKFVSLLEKRSLFFARSDQLGDPFEGSLSSVNWRLHPELYGEHNETIERQLTDFYRDQRYCVYISCWHLADHESAAMWRLYSREHDGIAIRTECRHLQASFQCEEAIFVGMVNYVDYETTFIPENNVLLPYFHKRREFHHEQEVRAISNQLFNQDGSRSLGARAQSLGEYYAVELSTLVQEIVVAPYAPDWFIELVSSVAERYGLGNRVRRSSLSTTPTWSR
ncbi:MAG: DUF2971 domain-containing protein [Chloroflexi bacterium]|nr:DUF2971 domain-containing protein [Chloroflexota bacterium]